MTIICAGDDIVQVMTPNATTAANLPDDVYRDLVNLHSAMTAMVMPAVMTVWRREG